MKKQENKAEQMLAIAHDLLNAAEELQKENTELRQWKAEFEEQAKGQSLVSNSDLEKANAKIAELKGTLDRSRQLTREAIGREDKLKNELAELKAGLNKQSELPQDTQLKINTLQGVISDKNKEIANFKEQVSGLKDESNNLHKELADTQAELDTTQRDLKRAKDTLSKEPNFGWMWNYIEDATPLDQEQVLVVTKEGAIYLKTYTPECGWRAEEFAWMSIPEIVKQPKADVDNN